MKRIKINKLITINNIEYINIMTLLGYKYYIPFDKDIKVINIDIFKKELLPLEKENIKIEKRSFIRKLDPFINIPRIGGLYCLFYEKNIIYIGKSIIDISYRIIDHLYRYKYTSFSYINKYELADIITGISYPLNKENEINEILEWQEKIQIAYYSPLYNITYSKKLSNHELRKRHAY